LNSHPTSAAAARRFVDSVLVEWSWADGSHDAVLLCTDELVTNAIIHVASEIIVVVRREDGTLRVEVHDRSSRPPLRRVHPIDAESGRGLELIEALSERWGVDAEEGGKAVWFELSA
jgi:anti-sigma regulatory factor (Ser/Thr protein kinase)